jgi:hypothetical protein
MLAQAAKESSSPYSMKKLFEKVVEELECGLIRLEEEVPTEVGGNFSY